MTYYTHIDSPIGPLLAVSDGAALIGLYMNEHLRGPKVRPEWVEKHDAQPLAEVACQIGEYFAGTRTRFEIPLAPRGTEFQKAVWDALVAIPFGETRSYGQLAAQLGVPNASRAVGMANARNPISIIVPCHRVIGSSGKLTGYAGGLDNKARLLDHERGNLFALRG